MTFAKGAALDDPAGLFNSSLEGNVRRAIDFHEGETIDEKALKALIRDAVKLNASEKPSADPAVDGACQAGSLIQRNASIAVSSSEPSRVISVSSDVN